MLHGLSFAVKPSEQIEILTRALASEGWGTGRIELRAPEFLLASNNVVRGVRMRLEGDALWKASTVWKISLEGEPDKHPLILTGGKRPEKYWVTSTRFGIGSVGVTQGLALAIPLLKAGYTGIVEFRCVSPTGSQAFVGDIRLTVVPEKDFSRLSVYWRVEQDEPEWQHMRPAISVLREFGLSEIKGEAFQSVLTVA